MGCIRLYVEPSERLARKLTNGFVPVIDCNPDQAAELKQRLTRIGYSVTAIPI